MEETGSYKRFGSLRVLTIDSDEIGRQYHTRCLNRLGIHCESANDQEHAEKLIQNARGQEAEYDVCFVNLDTKIGRACMKHLGEDLKQDGTVTVCLCHDNVKENASGTGTDYVLVRPVLQTALYGLMTEICRTCSVIGRRRSAKRR